MVLLGSLHEDAGKHDEATRWWKQAADQGSKQAQALLTLQEWRREEPEASDLLYVEAPHLYQGWNNCGATSMAMLARHAGTDATPYQIKRLCPQSPIGTGTDWQDLIAAGTELGQHWRPGDLPARSGRIRPRRADDTRASR